MVATIPRRQDFRHRLRSYGPWLYWPLDKDHGGKNLGSAGGDVVPQNGLVVGNSDARHLGLGSTDITTANGYGQSTLACFADAQPITVVCLARRDTQTGLDGFFSSSGANWCVLSARGSGTNVSWYVDQLDRVTWVGAWKPIGVWGLLGFEFDPAGDVAELFVDGVSKGQLAVTTPYGAAPGNFAVSGGSAWDGQLQHLAVYSKRLGAAAHRELAQLARLA